jgi:putative membrane protein
MKVLSYVALLLGLAAVALMVAWQGFGAVAGILAASGWGLLLLPLVWLPTLALGAAGWRLLFPPGRAPHLLRAMSAMLMGRAVNTLLPAASIGGEVIKARALALWGTVAADAGASVVVDKTVQALSLVLWALVGIGLMMSRAANDALVAAAMAGVALITCGVFGFIAVQHVGMFGFLARSAARVSGLAKRSGLAAGADEVDAALRGLYRRPGRIAAAVTLRLAGRVLLTAEIWLAAYLMGHPITLLEAVMLKSMAGAVRGAFFVVPSAIGVQEGSYIVIGALAGLSPEFMLALSLATRVRELLVSVPGLLAWQHLEGRALWKRLNAGAGRPLE